jgi:hypothetical protein
VDLNRGVINKEAITEITNASIDTIKRGFHLENKY